MQSTGSQKTLVIDHYTWKNGRHKKLALLAKEGFNLDVLLNPKPTTISLPPEPHYEPTDDPTEVTERERKSLKAQLKLSWELNRQKITDVRKHCRDRPWDLSDEKRVSLLYLVIGN